MRSLNLDQLRTFAEVAAKGSFSAAARSLHLSQPAVSAQVKELEGRVGVPLLERMGKKVYPTAAGHSLLSHAATIGEQAERALDDMRRHREGWLGRVRLGTASTVCVHLLPPIIRALGRSHPNLELLVRSTTTDTILSALVDNQLDIGVATVEPPLHPLIEGVHLRDDPMLAVFPLETHDEASLPQRVDAAFLSRQRLIFSTRNTRSAQLVWRWFGASGITPHPAMEIGDAEAQKSLVANGIGASVIAIERPDDPLLAGKVAMRPLDPPLVRSLLLIQRRDKPVDTALGIVREALFGLSTNAAEVV